MAAAEVFAVQTASQIERAVTDAAIVIVSKGVGLLNGAISSGISNKEADEAATHPVFTKDALSSLKNVSWDKPSKHAAVIVSARQDYISADTDAEKKQALLRMADAATRIEPGLRQHMTPFNFDRDDNGVPTAHYKKPLEGSIPDMFSQFMRMDKPRRSTLERKRNPQ